MTTKPEKLRKQLVDKIPDGMDYVLVIIDPSIHKVASATRISSDLVDVMGTELIRLVAVSKL